MKYILKYILIAVGSVILFTMWLFMTIWDFKGKNNYTVLETFAHEVVKEVASMSTEDIISAVTAMMVAGVFFMFAFFLFH